jgi:hypothetical protein
MAKNNYTPSKSLYTIKKFHSKTSGGTIFENDHISIIPNDDLYDDMPLFSDSNFRYRIREEDGNRKKHINSSWVKPENSDDEVWTLDNLGEISISEESKIVTKPNYTSLRDFAYYGSAVELIKATVNDIVLRFPGGLYFYKDNPLSMWVCNTEYYLIANDFNIDCWTANYVDPESVKNPMRILSTSYENYNDGNGKTLKKPIITINNYGLGKIIGTCQVGGYVLHIYLDENGDKYLIYETSKHDEWKGKTIIKPKDNFVNDFWDSLDDFERVLLNRDTTPVYKAEFETPFTDDTGRYYQMESYVWPTVNNDGLTPDITTSKFQTYLQSLISLAEFHDEYDTDNIWRMMTHESIKNLDWTFTSNTGEELDDMDEIDSGRMKAMVHIQGRIYDDLKRNIDTIKQTNNITYNQKSNIPDYFLSDIVENDGWEAKNVSNFNTVTDQDIKLNDTTGKKVSILEKSGKTDTYVNINFLRRLALSSNYIQSMKGTRRGLETIIGMFGYTYNDALSSIGDYSITEYYIEACGSTDANGYKGEFPNYCKASNLRVLFDYVNGDDITNFMQGYPVAKVEYFNENNEDASYLIPWFNKDIKYKHPFYFQSKGGWGKTNEKYLNKPELTTITKITGDKLYSETAPYMVFVKNTDEMLSITNSKLKNGLICYVEDIENLSKVYNDNNPNNDYSHYFIIENTLFSGILGIDKNCLGWQNIRNHEFYKDSTLTDNGKKVLYLESLISDEKGNNSHTGKGEYDDGLEYFKKFKTLFGDDVKNGVLEKVEDIDDNIEDIKNFGFHLTGLIIDNKKCYFFGDDTLKDKVFYNPETLKKDRGEASANSVINTKHLTLKFQTKNNEDMKRYIKDVVLKYAYEMIPSTSIVEILFDEETSMFNNLESVAQYRVRVYGE